MRKLSDFCKSGASREELAKRVRSLTFIVVDDGVYDVMGDLNFSCLGLSSLLEVATLLKELIGSAVPVWIRKVYGNFDCSVNHLTDLQGAPEWVEGNFNCSYNQLETLEGAPRYVGGHFECRYNSLKDLQGAPQHVGGSFYCSHNQLVSLEGVPRRIEGAFDCRLNYLQTLQGAPEWVGGSFVCAFNELFSLEGAPKYVGGEFYCFRNPKKFTEEEVRKLVNVKEEVWTSD
jgi:hypothetical protein